MASNLNEKLRETIATRITADYAAQGGTLALKWPNQPVDKRNGYISISWRKGELLGGSFFARREIVPVFLYGLVFVPRDSGTRTGNQEADKLADALRGQTYTVISNTPAGTTPARPLNGANPVASIVTANLRLHDPIVDDVGTRADVAGVDEPSTWYQINVTTEGQLTVKYGAIA